MALNDYGWFLDGSPGGTGMKVYSQQILDAGKYYWEVTTDAAAADGTAGYGVHCGVCTGALLLTGTLATAVNVPQGPGGQFINWRAANPISDAPGWGSPTRMGGITGGEPLAVGAKMGFALDTVNNKLWVRNVTDGVPAGGWAGGASQSGDPATNVSGADLAANGLDGFLYVMVGASHGAAAAKGVGTINFGASAFTGTAPTGFVSIYSVFPTAKLNSADNSNLVLSNGDLTFSGENVPVTFSPAIEGFTTNVGYSSSCRANFLIAQS
jgi:hypothetical protein